ncbi:STAS domain-containing protein [Actinomadura sp. KC06]|uniref:STAS domain-containing protein n=1 Tax=Actinomadura sp. KC06 TaxID=2530369 RepID=UPI0014045D0C|nr:STAS domain-containing protein [Actinomadura sp. KC06]
MTDHAGDRPPSTPGERLSARTESCAGGRVLVVHVDGQIDLFTADLLRERVLSAALPATPPRLVLDLDRVSFCDASGLSALVLIWKEVRAHDGDMVIARPPGMCRRILHRTALDQAIHVTATLDRAITHLTR